MQLKILSEKFYANYAHCSEILKKENAFHTIGEAGLDYTKSVIITDALFLSDEKPSIESREFAIIKREENKIRYGLAKYVNQYKRAMRHQDNPRSLNILKYSTLKYFEEYL